MASTITLTEAAAKYGINSVAGQMDYSALLQGVRDYWSDPADPDVGQVVTIRADFYSGFYVDTVGTVREIDVWVQSISLYSPQGELLHQFLPDPNNGTSIGPTSASLDEMRHIVTVLGNSADNVIRPNSRTHALSVDGGAGFDLVDLTEVPYLSPPDSYFNPDGHYVVNMSSSLGGLGLELINVERVVYDDWAQAYDIDGRAGQAYRLYQAAFDRQPDLAGLGFQIDALDQGATLHAIAQNFLDSPEFGALYGSNMSDEAFVTALYANVLHRAPEAAGFDYQVNALKTIDRAQLLMNFSESPENQAAVIGSIQTGIEYVPHY